MQNDGTIFGNTYQQIGKLQNRGTAARLRQAPGGQLWRADCLPCSKLGNSCDPVFPLPLFAHFVHLISPHPFRPIRCPVSTSKHIARLCPSPRNCPSSQQAGGNLLSVHYTTQGLVCAICTSISCGCVCGLPSLSPKQRSAAPFCAGAACFARRLVACSVAVAFLAAL